MSHKIIAGFSLIEVLISLALFSGMVLGFEAMQIYTLRNLRNAYYFHVASHQIWQVEERLRALQTYDGLTQIIAIWDQQNQALLPNGVGQIEGTYPNYALSIAWGRNPLKNCHTISMGETGCISQTVHVAMDSL